MTEVNYNDGNWWGWNGGECPVHPESQVEYAMRDGAEISKSKSLRWNHDDSHGDIIAFRVIKQYKSPREWWVHIPLIGFVDAAYTDKDRALKDFSIYGGEIIHVREVKE